MATVSVLPATLNYKITRGDDFTDVVTIKEGDPATPADLTGRTYAAQLRQTLTDLVVATFAIDMSSAASGQIGYSLPAATTDDLHGKYVWDLQQTAGGVTRTLMGGSFAVNADATRSS